MKQNKVVLLVFLFLIILPILVFWYGPSFKVNLSENIFLIILFIPVLGSMIIIYTNYIKNKMKSWYIIGLILLIITFFIFYSIYSLSNFGF